MISVILKYMNKKINGTHTFAISYLNRDFSDVEYLLLL